MSDTFNASSCLATVAWVLSEINAALARHVAECHAPATISHGACVLKPCCRCGKPCCTVEEHMDGACKGACQLTCKHWVCSPECWDVEAEIEDEHAPAAVLAPGESKTVATPPHDGSHWHTRVQVSGASPAYVALLERDLAEAREVAQAYQRAVMECCDVADTHSASPADVLTIARRRDEARKAREIDVEALRAAMVELWLRGEWSLPEHMGSRVQWIADRYRAELAKKEGR